MVSSYAGWNFRVFSIWLYLEGEQPGAYQSDILTQEVIGVIVDEFGYAEDTAHRFHQDMIYFTYECFQLGKHTVERVCSGLSPLRRDRLWC